LISNSSSQRKDGFQRGSWHSHCLVATSVARLLHEYLLYADSLPPDITPPPGMEAPTGFKMAGAFYEKFATAMLPEEEVGYSVLGETLTGEALEAQGERLAAEPASDVAFQIRANARPTALPEQLDPGRRRAPDAPPSSPAYKADVGAMSRFYQLHKCGPCCYKGALRLSTLNPLTQAKAAIGSAASDIRGRRSARRRWPSVAASTSERTSRCRATTAGTLIVSLCDAPLTLVQAECVQRAADANVARQRRPAAHRRRARQRPVRHPRCPLRGRRHQA
jgi:hypothetical protein